MISKLFITYWFKPINKKDNIEKNSFLNIMSQITKAFISANLTHPNLEP